MASIRQIFRPSIPDVLTVLLELDPLSVDTLKNEIQGQDALDVDQERCSRIGKLINIDGETAAVLLSTLSFLYSQVHGLSGDIPFDKRISAIVKEFIESKKT
jgi:hypothetical protein